MKPGQRLGMAEVIAGKVRSILTPYTLHPFPVLPSTGCIGRSAGPYTGHRHIVSVYRQLDIATVLQSMQLIVPCNHANIPAANRQM